MKRYRELDLSEVLRMLADNQEQTFAFRDHPESEWIEAELLGIRFKVRPEYSICVMKNTYYTVRRIAEIIEIPAPLIPLKKLEAIQELHPNHEWIAMDESGKAYLYQYQSPINSESMWYNGYAYMRIPSLDGYAPNWRESLIHIPTEIERIKKLEAEA